MFRLLRLDEDSILKTATLALILFMMAANALWNYLFFRARNLFVILSAAGLAPILDVSLFICLIQLDKNSGMGVSSIFDLSPVCRLCGLRDCEDESFG